MPYLKIEGLKSIFLIIVRFMRNIEVQFDLKLLCIRFCKDTDTHMQVFCHEKVYP